MSTKKVNYIITDNNITVNFDGQTHIVARTDGLAAKLIDALRQNKLNEIPNLVSAAKRIENFSKGNFMVQDGQILVNGVPAPKVLGDKIVRFSNEGLPFQPLVKFAERLQKNPSFRAVNELFQFLEKNDHPITENGCFVAYKKVRPNFLDIHSGTMDNSPGKTVEMNRNQVNEDPNQTCSNGLHVANWDYAANHFGSQSDVMLEVEVDPMDVVAVPVDYNQSKMRTCKYKVLGVVDHEHSDVPLRVVNPSHNFNDDLNEDMQESEEEDYCQNCDTYDHHTDDCDDGCDECGDTYCDRDCVDEEEYPWEDEVK